ncbi:MAG: VanZ family protein [Acholeplasmatales bacterium]|nr:VanZ family protein [Acholeplasmatales bacterium]
MKKKIYTIIFALIYIALYIFFILKSAETGEESTGSSMIVAKMIRNVLNSLFNTHIEIDDHFLNLVRKLIGHFGFFVVFGIVSIILFILIHSLGIIKNAVLVGIYHYIGGLSLAIISEFVCQALTTNRGPSYKDVMIDYSGYIIISSIIYIVFIVKCKRNRVN